jgi:hypothetical protein
MTTPLFPSVIGWNLLDGGTDAQDGNAYPGPALQDWAAAVVGAAAVATTWANRAQAQSARFAFFTDVGIGGGSYWYYTGGRWRPYGGRVTLKNLITDITNNAAAKIVMDYCTLPAGLWQDGDRLVVEWDKDRTGGTSDTDQTEILLGTVPLTLGTALGLVTSALATSNIQVNAEYKLRRVSSTSVRTQSVQGATGFGQANSNTVLTTVSNLDTTEQYLQISSDLTTAGGEIVTLRSFVVTLIAGA